MKTKATTLIKTALILIVIMANIGCDQVSKHLVRQRMSYNEDIGFIGNHFTLTKVENTGAFLSLGDNIPLKVKFVLLTLIPLLMLCVGIVYLIRKDLSKTPLVAACFIIGGGIGNIYDRILFGSVTDFMHIGFGFLQTGIFNMADVSVSVGACMMVAWYYWKARVEKKALKAEI